MLKKVTEYESELKIDAPTTHEVAVKLVKAEPSTQSKSKKFVVEGRKRREVIQVPTSKILLGIEGMTRENQIALEFGAITKPDGERLINISSPEQMLEVASLIQACDGDVDEALRRCKELALDVDASFPWDLGEFSDLRDQYISELEYEFTQPMVIRRPDGKTCKNCRSEDVIASVRQVRSIDEGLEAKMTCARCSRAYVGY